MKTDKELKEINISKKFIETKEFTKKEKDLFIEFIRRLEREEALEEVEKMIKESTYREGIRDICDPDLLRELLIKLKKENNEDV